MNKSHCERNEMECSNLPLAKEEIASPIKLARNDRVFGILLTIIKNPTSLLTCSNFTTQALT